jgi:hypothetical protein
VYSTAFARKVNNSLRLWPLWSSVTGHGQNHCPCALVLSLEEQQQLQSLANSRAAPLREVQRARILLGYHAGQGFSALSRTTRLSRRIIYKHVDRALAAGVAVALRDRAHGSEPIITPEAKAWVLALACTKPKDHGLAAELWTRSALAKHIRRSARPLGIPRWRELPNRRSM